MIGLNKLPEFLSEERFSSAIVGMAAFSLTTHLFLTFSRRQAEQTPRKETLNLAQITEVETNSILARNIEIAEEIMQKTAIGLNSGTSDSRASNVEGFSITDSTTSNEIKPTPSVRVPESVIRLRPTKPVPPTEVIVAAGPGGYAWNRKLIEKMRASLQQNKTITSFTVLGDGEQNLSIDSVVDAIKTAKEKRLAINLFIQTHGKVVERKHQLSFGRKSISSRVLFQKIRRELGDEYPLFIFMTACYGGAVGNIAAEELPKGTTFVALSRGDSVVGGHDVERFVNQMSSNTSWYNSEKMLYSYLATLQNRYVPSITYAPNWPLDLERVLQSQLGRSLSELQTTEVCHSISDWISTSEGMRLIEKIKRSSSTYDFLAVEWGKALAVSLSMSKVHKSMGSLKKEKML